MKKHIKVLLTLCIVLGMFSMTAYAEENEKPFEYEEEEIISTVQGILQEVDAFSIDELEYYTQNSLGITKTVCEDYLEYKEKDTLGDFVEFKDSSVENTENSAIVTITAVYEKKELTMTATYKAIGTQIVPTEVVMSTSDGDNTSKLEAVKSAGLNTLMGISVVVIVLILISFLISLFSFIPKLQDKLSNRKNNKDTEMTAVDNAVARIEEAEELTNDTELVAVITAAICAATNSSSDGFVVRSIRKRRFK